MRAHLTAGLRAAVAPLVAIRLPAAALAVTLAAGCGTLGGGMGDHGAPARDRVREVASTGQERAYLMHAPPGGAAGRPVVLSFHGLNGGSRGMERLTHLDQVADRYGFTVVYPDGPRGGWNGVAGPAATAQVAFVTRVLDDVVGRGHADGRRVFAVGLSTGGMFTELLACSLAGRLVAVAAVAGPMPAGTAPRCHPSRPVAVLLMHGTQDPVIPYGGGTTAPRAGGVAVLSVAATGELWRHLDGCTARPQTRELPGRVRDGTRVSVTVSSGCGRGTSVATYTIAGGGHAWPGGSRSMPHTVVGRTSRDFDAGQVMWRFFAQVPAA